MVLVHFMHSRYPTVYYQVELISGRVHTSTIHKIGGDRQVPPNGATTKFIPTRNGYDKLVVVFADFVQNRKAHGP